MRLSQSYIASLTIYVVGALPDFPQATPVPANSLVPRQATVTTSCFAFEGGLLCGTSFSQATATSTQRIPPSPTNSGVCSLHIDHYHCEDEDGPTATGAEASASYSSARGPMPTGRGNCVPHLDHWDCDLNEQGEAETISESGGEGCVQHGTHFHCPAGVTAGCDLSALGYYNLPLHIAAFFVLLVASGFGVVTPVVFGTRTRPGLRRVFFALKHFGTGVILSTAYIHLLLHAFVMFSNECLGELPYEPISPAIVMASVMTVFLVDFFGARWMAARRRGTFVSEKSPASVENVHAQPTAGQDLGHSHGGGPIMLYDGASKQAHWDVQLLEAGIVFHSIMIGVTLGAQSGQGFIPTFIAIVFHQLFEGLGLGARIATLVYPKGRTLKKWLMCLAYALVTPIGIAIGISVRKSYNLNGKASLLVIGVLDSISAGILLYTGIAQLLAMEWVNGDMRNAPLKEVVIALASLLLGLFAMSVIGKWA